jgi:PAS domain S-box-containing protein
MNISSSVSRPLRGKLLLPLMGLGILLIILTIWGVNRRLQQQLVEKLSYRAELIANTVNYVAEGVSRSGELQRIVTALGAEHEVEFIIVVGGTPKHVLASTKSVYLRKYLNEIPELDFVLDLNAAIEDRSTIQHLNQENGIYHIAIPLPMNGYGNDEKSLQSGLVFVELDSKPTQAAIDRATKELSFWLVVLLILLAISSYWLLKRHVIGPIEAIANRLFSPQPEQILKWPRFDLNDEIGLLASTLDTKIIALAESEARFRVMANSAPVLIWMAGLHRQCFWFNQVWLDFTGRTMEQEFGIGWVEDVHPEDIERCRAIYDSHYDRREEFLMDYRVKRHDGEYRWIQDHGIPRFDANQQFLGYIGSCVDITEKILTEERLRASEAFAKATIDAVSSHLCVIDQTGKILTVNKAWQDFYENNSAAKDHCNFWLGQNYLKVCDSAVGNFSNEAKLVSDGIRKVICGELEEFSIEYPCQSPAEQFWFQFKVRKFFGESGNLVISHENITNRKLADAERSLLLNIIMEAQDFIKCSNMDGHLTFLNPAGARMVGLPEDVDITDLEIKDMHPAWASKRILEEAIPVVLRDGFWQGETALWNRVEQREIPVSQMIFLQRDADGNPRQISTIMRDITAFKEVEKVMQQAKESAENLAKSKSEFLAVMSHEIRTPMNAIIGLSRLALNQEISDDVRDFLEKINISSESLLGILNDILDYSKMEAGKLHIENQVFNLDKVLENLRNLFSHRAEEKNIEFDVEVDANAPRFLVGDSLRLQQILCNLLGNAIKFTEQGRVVIKIKLVELIESQAKLEIAVFDTGIGMSQVDQSKLFQPFSQIDSSATRQFGGTGLGLAISRNLIKLMGSDMQVQSTPGMGSTFSFELLFSVASPELKPESKSSLERRRAGALSQDLRARGKTLIGMRILVAEDNRINQHVLKEFLKLSGILVDIANNGKEALDLLGRNTYDAVLMDVHMPEMGGREATEHIRRQPQFDGIPVIAVTAGVTQEERNDSLAAGMNDIITKPIKPESLIDILVKWIKPKIVADTAHVNSDH